MKPFVNVINIKGPYNQCAITTRETRLNIVRPSIPTPPRPPPSGLQYNIFEHLGNMPAQISILDILHTSPLYQEILDSSLHDSHVLTDIKTTKFHNLVGHLFTSCALSLKTLDIPIVDLDHILPLCIVVMVSNFVFKRVMIDNGSALNLCTLKFIKHVRYNEANILNKVITIKEYDNLEQTTKGTIILPIRVGPTTQETICNVVYLNLEHNILLS